MRGREVGTEYKPSRKTRPWVSYAYTDTNSPNPSEALTDSAPRHTLSLLLSHQFPRRLQGGLAYYYVAEYEPIGTENLLDPARRLDLRLAQGFSAGSTDGELALVVQNAFDAYSELKVENRYDTRAFATVSLQFR